MNALQATQFPFEIIKATKEGEITIGQCLRILYLLGGVLEYPEAKN